MTLLLRKEFELFADFFHFYLQDDDIKFGDLSAAWTKDTYERMLALAPHTIGVRTARNMTVPVCVTLCEERPDVEVKVFDRWNECTIQIDTGRIVVAGCGEYFPGAERIDCEPGIYVALIGYKNLDSLSANGLEGHDSYHVFLWRNA